MQINIDCDALVHNVKVFHSLVKGKLCGVVKSNGYGHGAITVANCIRDYVDYFAVSTVAEALQLSPLSKKTLILLPLDIADMVVAINNSCSVIVDSYSTFERLRVAMATAALRPYVHIKVDTGMHRLGCSPCEVKNIARQLADSGAMVEGICSHCACGDNEVYTAYQREIFIGCCNDCAETLGYMPLRHFANTSATLSSDKNHFDMVRVGLGLYGYGCNLLKPAKRILGHVVATKRVIKGECIGYDNTYISPCDGNISIVDIGYNNGVSTTIPSIVVLHDNIRYKAVGKVCMSMIIIDTSTNVLKPFDQVEILGNNTSIQYDCNYSIYELLCNTK